MLSLLVDTSVWLDLAKNRDGQLTIVPIRLLVLQQSLELLVPQIITDEFQRNRPRVEAAATKSVHERFRLLRNDVSAYANSETRQWVDEMAHQIPYLSSRALQNFSEIADLLQNGRHLEPSADDHAAVIARSLAKRAPFHLNKNSVADALLMETYASACRASHDPAHKFGFVTANHHDFSVPNGDQRKPHPDLDSFFDGDRSSYYHNVDGLTQALLTHFGNEFTELVTETQKVQQEPRALQEIVGAHNEYRQRIWYFRRVLQEEQDLDEGLDSIDDLHVGLAERVEKIMEKIEGWYEESELIPESEFDWGYWNGTLATLRWVLGDEWGSLDT
ncbi:hypothetical protein GCM10022247_35670 [Allokutzneria multivorans]|uniref:DUF4935 domain-containing protein n=1 Tax=Allokutzneria multivorans TaxID=1142134 RepID=A0ABP7SE47_9PSEU